MVFRSDCNVIIGFLSASCIMICHGQNLNASFIFGDSLVDAGNNNYIVSLSKANYLPNGIDFLPSRQPTGRFTNGRTIADILGQELGLQSFTDPYLAPSNVGFAVLNGVNYASGGGGILNATGEIFGGRINLDAQIDNYANTRQDIISSLGMASAFRQLRTSLFSVTIGSNDFINNYLTPVLSVPQSAKKPPETFIEDMISKYRTQLTRLYYLDARKIIVTNVGPIGCIPYLREINPSRLYYLDARKIIVTNVGPIGCIPYLREINPSAGKNCVEFPNQLAQHFNEKLKSLLVELSSSLNGSLFVYADVYNSVSDIIQNYNSYGFEVADSACCSVSGRFGGMVPCGPTSKVCADRSKYVFWDPYHPSDAANVILAKRLLDGDANDIFPMNVRQLLQAPSMNE